MAGAGLDQARRFNELVFTQVLNMDRSTDRLAVIDGYLKAAGVEYARFSAVDGRKLDLDNDPELKRMVDLKGWVRRHHRNPSPADVGCYLSHYYAIKAFAEQAKPLGLIFEDDAAVAPDFIRLVLPAIEDCGSWDILKLHARHPGPLVERKCYGPEVSLCSYLARHAGGTAYVISHKAAAKMLKHLMPAVKMIDWAHDEGHVMNLRVRTLKPGPVTLQDVVSTRETLKKKRSWIERQTDRPILPRWQLPFRRAADEVHRFAFNLFADGGLKAMLLGPEESAAISPADTSPATAPQAQHR
jgi:glycosyl transferase family 25